jgi:hypothetical protein
MCHGAREKIDHWFGDSRYYNTQRPTRRHPTRLPLQTMPMTDSIRTRMDPEVRGCGRAWVSDQRDGAGDMHERRMRVSAYRVRVTSYVGVGRLTFALGFGFDVGCLTRTVCKSRHRTFDGVGLAADHDRLNFRFDVERLIVDLALNGDTDYVDIGWHRIILVGRRQILVVLGVGLTSTSVLHGLVHLNFSSFRLK